MRIRFLGGFGGTSAGYQTTSILINESILIDAGSVASTLEVNDQKKIDHILLSHSHLDHIKDLAFLADNCFGLRSNPFLVYGHSETIQQVKTHIFNNSIWPDFSTLPTEKNPTVEFKELKKLLSFDLMGLKITPIPVNHIVGSLGFLIEENDKKVFFTLDTCSSNETWEKLNGLGTLDLIVTEVSFPNRLEDVAHASKHHTPKSFERELSLMPSHKRMILTHLKPFYKEEIQNELSHLGVEILFQDGLEILI